MNIGGIGGGVQPYTSALQSGPNAAQQAQLQEQQQQQATQQTQAQNDRTTTGSVTETRGNNLNIVV